MAPPRPAPALTLAVTGYTPHVLLIGGRPITVQVPIVRIGPPADRPPAAASAASRAAA